jgi:hypothetical protein
VFAYRLLYPGSLPSNSHPHRNPTPFPSAGSPLTTPCRRYASRPSTSAQRANSKRC